MDITWDKNIHTTKLDSHRRQKVLISKLEQLHNRQFEDHYPASYQELRIRVYRCSIALITKWKIRFTKKKRPPAS